MDTYDRDFPSTHGASAVDLYCGAGGLSLGLEMAGVSVVAAVEQDKWACATHALNMPKVPILQQPVAALPRDFFQRYRGVDIVAGGPPCQGFSISASHRRDRGDPRNQEVFRFIEAAIKLAPRLILLENVPEITRYALGHESLVAVVAKQLQKAGYSSQHWVVDCANFGVPQHRRRFFLIASLDRVPNLVAACTHADPQRNFEMPPWLSVQEAIGDLPEVAAGSVPEDAWLRYPGSAECGYQSTLRSSSGGCYNHVPMRHSPRLVDRFAAIPSGGNGAEVWASHPATARGDRSREGTRFAQNHRRLVWNTPAPTITAYMYSTCLHPSQHRNITVREAARLQSFPDTFQFLGKRTTLSAKLLERKGLFDDIGVNQLNQVGNAVPPQMGKVLGGLLLESLGGVANAKCA